MIITIGREHGSNGHLIALGLAKELGYRSLDKEIVDRSIDITGISPLASRRVGSLSDGERQKVMIAKAIAQETPVILLDEPTAFLDYPSKVDMLMLLSRISR